MNGPAKKIFPAGVEAIAVDSPLSPYLTAASYQRKIAKWGETNFKPQFSVWRRDLMGEVMRYGQIGGAIAAAEKFDVIHCHDWLSLPAGLAAKKVSKKPLVFHVHATEYDRVGPAGLNREICSVERLGFENADAVAAVSAYTKRRVVNDYGAAPGNTVVVPNAVNHSEYAGPADHLLKLKKSGKKNRAVCGAAHLSKRAGLFFARGARGGGGGQERDVCVLRRGRYGAMAD